jgi:efflux transporter, outer membrane factor (OMF) lipoprotein, NodT family
MPRRFFFFIILLPILFLFGYSIRAQTITSVFNDKLLDSLITIGLKNNKNVLQLMDRMAAAKASERIARAGFFPSVSVTGDWSRSRQSAALSATQHPVYSSVASLSATSMWEIDVFGKIRNNVKSQKELYKVSVDNLRWARISLASQIATTYINLRTYQQQYVVLQHNIQSQLGILNIVKARYNVGLASKLDVLQANSIYITTQAELPLLSSQIQQTINSIYILLGEAPTYPDSLITKPNYLNSSLLEIGSIPKANVDLMNNYTVSMDALLQRPDIKAYEYTVNSYAALVGASKADWLPEFYVKGSFGYSSGSFKSLFKRDNMTFAVNPTISWTLFEGRQIAENTKLAKANWSAAVNAFNLAVIEALQEVDDAVLLYYAYSQQYDDYKLVRDEGIQVLNLSLELYKKGLQNFQTVLDAQRSLLSYESSLVNVEGQMASAIVQIIKVGGLK